MGLSDFLSKALDTSTTGVDGLMKYGLLGNYLVNDKMQKMKENANDEHRGPFCPQACIRHKEECEECLRRQQFVVDAVSALMKLEKKIQEAKTRPQISNQKKLTNCTLCGAPWEKGLKNCPYCNTDYPAEVFESEIPEDEMEQQKLLLENCEKTYGMYCEWSRYHMDATKNTMIKNKDGILSKLAGGFSGTVQNYMKMNGAQIRQGAAHYNVSWVEYVVGVMSEKYETVGKMQLDAMSAQQKAYHDRNMEIERERQEKLRRINQEKNAAMGRMVYGKTTNWSANSGKQECWSCSYYYRPTNTCTRTNCVTSASGCCVYYK